ncbi:MAG: hypothetical protein QM627_02745 [Luteolibacter sp.]
MNADALGSHPQKTRKQTAEAINRALVRLPLLLDVLEELSKQDFPCAGDQELRHGCDRALTAMLSRLALIDPAPNGQVSNAEKIAESWLHEARAPRLIDASKLERLQQFIDRILGPKCSPPVK